MTSPKPNPQLDIAGLIERLEKGIAEAAEYFIADNKPETRQCALVEIGGDLYT